MGNDKEKNPVPAGLAVEYKSGRPVYLQLVEGLKSLVYSGRLKPGEQLPTVRALAAALDINPNTAARAYRELERDGVVSSRVGRGSFVAESAAAGPGSEHNRLAALEREFKERCAELGLSREQFLGYISKGKSGGKR